MKQIALEWVKKAEGDYKIALREMRTKSPVYDAVCFHAQQCLEKYFKALLTDKEIAFPRTHDLAVLLKLAAGVAPGLEGYSEELSELTAFAVAFRYPGEEATEREALEAVATMKGARRALRKVLPHLE